MAKTKTTKKSKSYVVVSAGSTDCVTFYDAKSREVIVSTVENKTTVSKPETGHEKTFEVSETEAIAAHVDFLIGCTQN